MAIGLSRAFLIWQDINEGVLINMKAIKVGVKLMCLLGAVVGGDLMRLHCACCIALLLATMAAHANPNIPAQRPYLALSPAEIARAKERVAQFGWAKQSLKHLLDAANSAIAQPLGNLPGPESAYRQDASSHLGISSRLFDAALAAALTGERRYADWVRDGLLAYADVYPKVPLRGGCKRLLASSLFEAEWLVRVTLAYDLVADSGAFSEAERQRVENDLLRVAAACFKVDDYEHDPRIKDLHFRCYNFQAWHIAAVGLVGLAVRDAALVDWAVNSRYGFKHLVAHDIRDDGLFWERSVGYHHFVLEALLPFTEAMMHCGVDLYRLTVPNDRSRDEDAHYVTDTSDKPKSLRLMFDAPFYLVFPDLSHVAPGDSGRGPLRADWLYLVGWCRYRDPKLAWLLRRDVRLAPDELGRGRVGFLHYYRYAYRYENVRLNGQALNWERLDATLEQQGDTLLANDGGLSQSDRYALSVADVADFTLEWTMTGLAAPGQQDRAWVIFHADAANLANCKAFALPPFLPEANRRYHFRLEVAGSEAKLLRDGQVVSTSPIVYRYGPDWRWLVYDAPQSAAPNLPLESSFANTGVFENGCSLFPSSGLVVLRQAGGDFTAQPDSTAVSLSYGPHGGAHGHADKLNIVLYAQGRQWIPDFGSMPYGTKLKEEWTAQTISHNTVVVDGVSQKPTGARDVQWPTDNARNKVMGRLDRFDPSRKLAVASCTNAYDNLVLRRAVQVCGRCVVDCFDISPALPRDRAPTHQFDYVLHVDGALTESTAPLLPRTGPLGNRCGYQHVGQQQGGTIHEVAALTFASGARRLHVWIVPAGGASVELILADGLTNAPDAKRPMLVVRRSGVQARFVTVFEPVDTGEPLTAVRFAGETLTLQRASGAERIPLAGLQERKNNLCSKEKRKHVSKGYTQKRSDRAFGRGRLQGSGKGRHVVSE